MSGLPLAMVDQVPGLTSRVKQLAIRAFGGQALSVLYTRIYLEADDLRKSVPGNRIHDIFWFARE